MTPGTVPPVAPSDLAKSRFPVGTSVTFPNGARGIVVDHSADKRRMRNVLVRWSLTNLKEWCDYRLLTASSSPVMTPATVKPVAPNQPKTPQRTVRISDEIWTAAQRRAAERGETLTDVVRRALEDYAR